MSNKHVQKFIWIHLLIVKVIYLKLQQMWSLRCINHYKLNYLFCFVIYFKAYSKIFIVKIKIPRNQKFLNFDNC